MSKADNFHGFLEPEFVQEAAAASESIRSGPLTPVQQEILDVADQAMREVESLFDGPINDQNIFFFKMVISALGFHDDKRGRLEARQALHALKPGDYIVADRLAYFKTVNGEMQEAQAYVNRLEKAVLDVMKTEAQNIAKLNGEINDLTKYNNALRSKISFVLQFQRNERVLRKKRAIAKRRKTLRAKSLLGKKRKSK